MRAKNATSSRMWIDGNDGKFTRFDARPKTPFIPKMGNEMLITADMENKESPDCTAMVRT